MTSEQKPREFWIVLFNDDTPGVYGYEAAALRQDNIWQIYHVIEYSALKQEQARIKELENEVSTGMELNFNTVQKKMQENAKLKAQLSDAVKALEEIAAEFGTDYCSGDTMIAYEALAKLKKEI